MTNCYNKQKGGAMGPIALAAFLGTFLLALLGVLIVKIYEKAKDEEHKIVEHHKHHKEDSE